MDSFNNRGFPLSNSNKPSIKDAAGKRSNNENELSPEMASKLKSPGKKQLPTKNFMSPTISAANRASVPQKKILGERNETPYFMERTSHLTSSSFGSKPLKSPVVGAANDNVLLPYDPITNYLSPRPKFLRYNPNRRRNMLVLLGNEDCVKPRSSCDAVGGELPSSDLEAGAGSSISSCSSSQKQSVEESEDVNNKEDDDGDETEEEEEEEEEEDEDEEEEKFEFGEDRCCSLKGISKVFLVVITLILTTQAICSMNSPSPLHTLESLWNFSDHYSNVYRTAGLNFSGVGYDLVKEPDLLVGRLKVGNVCHDYEGLDMIETIEDLVADSFHQDEMVSKDVENDEIEDVTQDEILQEHEIAASEVVEIDSVEAEKEVNDDVDQDDLIDLVADGIRQDEVVSKEVEHDETEDVTRDKILQEDETAASEVVVIANVEADKEVNDDVDRYDLIEGNDSDAEYEISQDMKEVVETEIVDIKATDVLMRLASIDPTFAASIGLSILILTTFCCIIIYRSKQMISISSTPVSTTIPKEKIAAEIQEIKILLQPTSNRPSSTEQIDDKQHLANLQKEVTKEISHIHAPSVELLNEFVFGEEVTSNISASDSMIQPTILSSSQTNYSHIEMSTGDSYTVKKQRRKTAVVTPSSVRRSSRLQSRSSS